MKILYRIIVSFRAVKLTKTY